MKNETEFKVSMSYDLKKMMEILASEYDMTLSGYFRFLIRHEFFKRHSYVIEKKEEF